MDEQKLTRAREWCRRLRDQDLATQYARGSHAVLPEAWQAVLEEIDRRGPAVQKHALQSSASMRGVVLCLTCAKEVPAEAKWCRHCGARLKVESEGSTPTGGKAAQGDSPLGTVGWILLPLGLLGVIWALQLDATVPVGFGGRSTTWACLTTSRTTSSLAALSQLSVRSWWDSEIAVRVSTCGVA